ncbi:MAG: hypothetical protein J2P23_02250 [Microlunatus sp.]|nr:hypothetical protein [Microlunatus sp.]
MKFAGIGAVAAVAARYGATPAAAEPVVDLPEANHQPLIHGYLAGDLRSWSPATDPFARYFRSRVPRAERIASLTATQAHPDLSPKTKLMVLGGDYRIDDIKNAVRYGNRPDAQTLNFWQYVDLHGAWHGCVTADQTPDGDIYGVINLPNPAWTDIGHRNGARVLGCWFWPRTDNFADYVVQSADGSFPIGDKLVEIADYFGFDGYFINQEATITAAQATALADMFAAMKAAKPSLYLQYYDADLPNGQLRYQNQLDDANIGWLGSADRPISDSIWLNYGWPFVDPDLSTSVATATAHGFVPTDVAFAGTEASQGGFNPREPMGPLVHPGSGTLISWALFNPDQLWTLENADPTTAAGRAQLRQFERYYWSGPLGDPTRTGKLEDAGPGRTNILDYKGWDGVAHSIAERSVVSGTPFVTAFSPGVGVGFSIEGARLTTNPWCNGGAADVLPTWQFWTRRSDGGDPLAVAASEDVSWDGPVSLALTGVTGPAKATTIRLYKTEVATSPSTWVRLRVRTADALPVIEVGVTYIDETSATHWLPTVPAAMINGWTALQARVPADRTIVAVSLRVSDRHDRNLDLRLGELAILDLQHGAPRPPMPPSGLRIDAAYTAGDVAEVFLSWTFEPTVHHYDILARHADGSVDWLGRITDEVFYVQQVRRAGGEPATRIGLTAVSAAAVRSGPTSVDLHW